MFYKYEVTSYLRAYRAIISGIGLHASTHEQVASLFPAVLSFLFPVNMLQMFAHVDFHKTTRAWPALFVKYKWLLGSKIQNI